MLLSQRLKHRLEIGWSPPWLVTIGGNDIQKTLLKEPLRTPFISRSRGPRQTARIHLYDTA